MRPHRLVFRAVAVCAALAIMAYGLVAAAPARASQPTATGWISSTGTSGGCLDDYNGQTAPFSVVDLSPCLVGSPDENFSMMTDGTMQIHGECLQAASAPTPNPNGFAFAVYLNGCDGDSAQKWTFNSSGELVNSWVTGGLGSGWGCLDASNGISSGAALPVDQCSGAASQQWGVPVYGDYGLPAQVTFSGGDVSVSMDDGGLDPATAQHVLSTLLPESESLPAGSSVNDITQTAYSQAMSVVQQQGHLGQNFPTPVSLPDQSVSVNGSTITLTVPQADIDQVNASAIEEEGAQILATLVANIVGMVSSLICWGAFLLGPLAPAFPFASLVCGLTSQFVNTITYLVTYYLIVEPQAAPTPPLRTILVTLFVNTLFNGTFAFGIFPSIAKFFAGWMVKAFAPSAVEGITRAAGATLASTTTRGILATAFAGVVLWAGAATAILWKIGRSINGVPYVVDGPGLITSMIPVPSSKPQKCLKVAAESSAPGSPAVSWDCDPGNPAEQFQFWSNGEVVSDYGLCLTEPGPTVGALMIWQACTGAANQIFSFNSNTLVVKDSGLCLEIPGATIINNTQLVANTCGSTPESRQQWSLPAPAVTGGG